MFVSFLYQWFVNSYFCLGSLTNVFSQFFGIVQATISGQSNISITLSSAVSEWVNGPDKKYLLGISTLFSFSKSSF